jgi:hypothetical protein
MLCFVTTVAHAGPGSKQLPMALRGKTTTFSMLALSQLNKREHVKMSANTLAHRYSDLVRPAVACSKRLAYNRAITKTVADTNVRSYKYRLLIHISCVSFFTPQV